MDATGQLIRYLRPVVMRLARITRAVWRGLLLFLEVIGLRPAREVAHDYNLARFKQYHTEFRRLLSANNGFLENVAALEQKLAADEFFDRSFVERTTVRMIADIHHMVSSIKVISGDRYPALSPAFGEITAALTRVVDDRSDTTTSELVVDLTALSAKQALVAGGKMANLGEIKTHLGLPTPDGFAVTSFGYRHLIEEGGIKASLETTLLDLKADAEARDTSAALRLRILQLQPPHRLRDAILAAYDRLAARRGFAPKVAVRSTAIGEDGKLSFAGQFMSMLNVDRAGLLDAYLGVVASLFSYEAICYRLHHRIPNSSAAMAVGFVEMVDALASGVVFSNDPNHPVPGQVVIHAVRGLGVTLADGSTHPEQILVSRNGETRLLGRTPSNQSEAIVCRDGAGVDTVPISSDAGAQPSINDAQALELSRWALALEAHFKCPQDVEWAIDEHRQLTLLQTRPLRLQQPVTSSSAPLSGYQLLLTDGEVACPGIGIGPAVHLNENDDLASFPNNGVLIARHSSPKFVTLMARASAIVTDTGSTTGHMASLAREYGLPALLNTRTATHDIPQGTVVTVDAASGLVYAGVVAELVEKGRKDRDTRKPGGRMHGTAVFDLLERAATLIVPLNLTDPRASGFAPDLCRTLHDLARFIHEKSYEEMFHMGERLGDMRSASYHLDVFLPIDLYIIDLGGGLNTPIPGRNVKPGQLASVPLAALLRGMLDKRIPRYGPRPLDVQGLVSVMMRHAVTDPESEPTFRDPSYALVSDRYLNYTARVGYHFGVVDTYCCATANKNYVSVLFRGGAADLTRRRRRARAIRGILTECGFAADQNEDLVNARLSKASQPETVAQLEMVGRLLQFMRQMDLAMVSEESVAWAQKAFLAGDYDLVGRGP